MMRASRRAGAAAAFLLPLLLLGTPSARSQGCCTSGVITLGGLESGVLPAGMLSAGVNYQYTALDATYQGTEQIDDPLRRSAAVAHVTLQVEYGLAPGVSLLGLLPYADKSRTITVESGPAGSGQTETETFEGAGIGDVSLLVKFQLVKPTLFSPLEVALGGGATFPTGSFTEEVNGARLSLDLQPGTGAPVLAGWSYAWFAWPEARAKAEAGMTYRYAGTNIDGYRVGDELSLLLGGRYGITDELGAALQVRSRFTGKDYADRRLLSATGGTFHDLVPLLDYGEGPVGIRAFAQVPLYRNVRGIQLTPSFSIGVELRFTVGTRAAAPAES
jgi:hypothetical protein